MTYVLEAKTPAETKKRGRSITPRSDWESIKWDVMLKVLCKKFGNNPDIMNKLLNTEQQLLAEGNHWHDRYWGMDLVDGVLGDGDNWLGIQLMTLRHIWGMNEEARDYPAAIVHGMATLCIREEWGSDDCLANLSRLGALNCP